MLKGLRTFAASHLSSSSGLLGAAILALTYLAFSRTVDFKFLGIFDLAAVSGVMVIGWFLGTLTIFPLLFQFLLSRRRKSGRDIEMNSRVRVRVGQFKGRIANVYEVWEFRGQARVELGQDAKDHFADVFYTYQLERAD